MRVWYNHGFSQTRDAFALIREAMPEAFLIATHGRETAPVLQIADHADGGVDQIVETDEGRLAYLDWCLDFARRHRVDVFVAQRARIFLARHAAAFAAIGTKLVVAADAGTLEAIEDKGSFYERCAAAGLPTPLTIPFHGEAEFQAAHRAIFDAGHSTCVKPRHGVFASGYYRLVENMPLFKSLMRIDDRVLDRNVFVTALRTNPEPSAMLAMQHLPGREWSVDCVCDQGEIIAAVSRSKHGYSQVIEGDGPAMDLARQVARLFDLSNLVNIQLKSSRKDRDVPHVLEINTRMSGGCAYAALAGVNLPYIQLLLATGRLDRSALPTPRRVLGASINQVIDISELEAAHVAEESEDA